MRPISCPLQGQVLPLKAVPGNAWLCRISIGMFQAIDCPMIAYTNNKEMTAFNPHNAKSR
jgi:hypothetical protein